MDDANRIPIDIGYEVAAATEADQRATLREDGTLVINILVTPPCAPEPSTESEIVVCAVAPVESGATIEAPPPEPTLAEKIGQALHAKIGPVEVGSVPKSDGTRAFGARIRF